ncbi:hypothetical protein ACLBNB_19235 [Pseudomonas chlororaphis subsp. aurantiaca]|uniref:hypothetical protein n=1 Tax=Pseudomonas chlororaphis TaxID=587753 RepID=UPI00398ACE18
MWFFKREGRATYLEFLRNLTPQILLFAFIVIVGDKISRGLSSLSFGVFVNGFMLLCFFLMWGWAFFANASLLYDKALSSCPDVEEYKNSLKGRGVKNYKAAWGTFIYTCKRHPLLVVEILMIIFVIYVGAILGMMSGVITAVGFVKNMS